MEDLRLFPTHLKQNMEWHWEDCCELILCKWLWAERIWICSKLEKYQIFPVTLGDVLCRAKICTQWSLQVPPSADSVISLLLFPEKIFFLHDQEPARSCWTIKVKWNICVLPQEPGWNYEIIPFVSKCEFSHKTLEFSWVYCQESDSPIYYLDLHRHYQCSKPSHSPLLDHSRLTKFILMILVRTEIKQRAVEQ